MVARANLTKNLITLYIIQSWYQGKVDLGDIKLHSLH